MKIDEEISQIIKRNYEIAKKILSDKRDTLELMSEALIVWETLDAEQINQIMEGKDIGLPVLKSEGLKGEVKKESTKKDDDGIDLTKEYADLTKDPKISPA